MVDHSAQHYLWGAWTTKTINVTKVCVVRSHSGAAKKYHYVALKKEQQLPT